MVFTVTYLQFSVQDYLNAVTATLIIKIGPEPIKTQFIAKIGFIDVQN